MITEKQLNNLKKLRDYMASLPEEYENFDMKKFAYKEGLYFFHPEEVKPECGTVCCLAGHGPLAGILPESKEAKLSWTDYCVEAFGCEVFTETGKLWEFLFSEAWPSNIPQAIERLDTAIKYKGNVPRKIAEKYMKEQNFCHRGRVFL